MSRPTLTTAVIAKNEEKNLRRWFESVKDLADEIIFVDTGSTDNTVALAKELGCTVHCFDWIEDFAAARNFAMDQVKTDYMFWCDLDDVVVNRDAFIHFRDHIMGVSDYWVNLYHYSVDDKDRTLCSFLRERVIRMDKGLRWKYFLHEGIAPVSTVGIPIRVDIIPSWHVKHLRSPEDLAKDKGRNLRIFEANMKKGPLDARMLYYLGKEYFEAQRPAEALPVLLNACLDKGLELHDRILAYQYAAWAAMSIGDFGKAIDIAHTALMISPHRAEYHCVMGDAYLKLGQMVNAIPSFAAAKNCMIGQDQPGVTGAIFTHEDSYKTYPRHQLAKVYANLGDLQRSLTEINESNRLFPDHAEGQEIEEQIKINIKKNTDHLSSTPTLCQDIVITCTPQSPYEWDPEIYKHKIMGGSETACIEMAKALHKLSGRPVKVFNMRERAQRFEGVEYIPANRVGEYFTEYQPWLHIAWRHNVKLTNAPTFLWCHDLFTPGGENTLHYTKVLALTPFHKNYLMGKQMIPSEKILVTRNGIVPDRFFKPFKEKDPMKVVFPSSPDRGLERAIRIVKKARETYPEMKLHVFYGIEHLHKYGPPMEALQKELKVMLDENKDFIVYHGATPQDKLMEEYRDAAVWLYPSDWIETSCITAKEILHSGVYPVVRRLGGVADTLAEAEELGMACLIDSDCKTEAEHLVYTQALIRAVADRAWERIKLDPYRDSWENVATEWLKELPKLF